MKILSATDFSTRSQRALRTAGLLARQVGAELTLLHVVDDDRPPALVELEKREAERILGEQIGSMDELRGVRCIPVVVGGDAFDAILKTAMSLRADLIVMGAHRKQLLRDIFVGTTIERVIRSGPFPVLMVNDDARAPYRSILAAVDMSEPSIRAIRTAKELGVIGEAQLTLVHGFLPVASGKMASAGIARDRIEAYEASERLRASRELTDFLAMKDLGVDGWSLRVRDGPAFEVISRAVREMAPDLVLVGTHGRSGIAKLLLGSVAEEVLRSIDVDILAVPPGDAI